MSEFVATENKETKPRNVQLDNAEAVRKLPGDDGRCAKMSNWLRKKFGMQQAEQNEESAAKGFPSKYLTRSIEAHERSQQPPKYEAEKLRLATNGDLFKSFNVPGLVGLGGSDKEEKKKKEKELRAKEKQKEEDVAIQRASEIKNETTQVQPRFTKHATSAARRTYWRDRKAYVDQYMPRISRPFCNFADQYETIKQYKKVLKWDFGNYTPIKIRVDCTLYHGCDPLLAGERSTRKSKEVYLTQTLSFNQVIKFEGLRYCQIPIKTRMAFSITLVFQENAELTIGCVSINLFDEKGQFRSGIQDLNIWPFYSIDERLGCMKEYNGMKSEDYRLHSLKGTLHMVFSKLVVGFESFICPMYYSSRDERKISIYQLMKTQEDIDDEAMLQEKSIDN